MNTESVFERETLSSGKKGTRREMPVGKPGCEKTSELPKEAVRLSSSLLD